MHSDSISNTIHTLFPQDPAFYVCTTCCKPYLRTNKHSDLWLARLAAGDLDGSAQGDFLKATSSRRCAKTGESYPNGVGCGWCLDCYFVHRPVTSKPRLTCASLLHGSVSTNKPPKTAPSPGVLHLLWPGAKAAEQAGLLARVREKVCEACKTLAQRRKFASPQPAGAADAASPTVEAAPQASVPAAPATLTADQGVGGPAAGVGVHAVGDAGPAEGVVAAAEPAAVVADLGVGAPAAGVRALVVGEGARVAVVGVPAQEQDCGSPLAAGGAEDAAGPLVDEVPAASTDSSAAQGVVVDPPVAATPSPDEAIAAVARSYAFLDPAQRHAVSGIVDLHLRTERPDELRMRLANGRDLLYQRTTVPLGGPVGQRQRRRRTNEAEALMERLYETDGSSMERMLTDVTRRARETGLFSVVPARALSAIPVRLHSQFVASNNISFETFQRFRRLVAPEVGLASREVMRADLAAARAEPRNQVTATPVGAILVSVRAALQAAVDDLTSRDELIERPVAGRPGGEVLVHFGLDKGGTQSTCKAVLSCANQAHPCRRDNTVPFGVFPCQKDDYLTMSTMAELFAEDLDDLRTNGISVRGATRSVRLILTGDYAFETTFLGHSGASGPMPCVWCCALARPTAAHVALIGIYGTLQDGSRAGKVPRTAEHAAEMALKYATGGNATLPTPLKLTSHRSITKQPLMVWDPADIAPMSLHITLGVTGWLIYLGVEAVVADRGSAEAAAYAAAIAGTLRDDVGVSPAPFWGGSFAGKQCHKIGARLSASCDRLDAFLSSARAAAYRRACRLWADLMPVLNRASPIDASERSDFGQRAAAFVDGLLADFEWVSITPKLHALACHAADFLDEFGSLGLFTEQGLEAWHGYVNQNAAVFAAPTFLSSCVRLVERAAIGRAPGSEAFNRGKRRATASPGARSAKRACDLGTN